MAQLIDEVSKALARGMPRRQVLKLLVTGAVGLALGRDLEVEMPPPAEASRRFFTGIVWPTPADITYGTALGSQQLDALAYINGQPIPLRFINGNPARGNYRYTPATGTVLPVGLGQLLKVTTTTTPSLSASTRINVVRDPTTVSVASALYNPTSRNWRFIADITTTPGTLASSASRPTGLVTFSLDGAALTPPATVSGSQAIYTAPAQAPGQHAVGAVYGGDTNYLGSTAPYVTIQQS
jgi:hypothetical protein